MSIERTRQAMHVHERTWIVVLCGALTLPGFLGSVVAEEGASPKRISQFGRYEGYSHPTFDGWVRTSEYIMVRDGTRIAVDIFRPTNDGVLHTDPLPVIWEHRRYQRASVETNGVIHSQLDRPDHPMRKVVSSPVSSDTAAEVR